MQRTSSIRLLLSSYTMHYFCLTDKCNITQVCEGDTEGDSASSALWSLALGRNQKERSPLNMGEIIFQHREAWRTLSDVILGALSRNTAPSH